MNKYFGWIAGIFALALLCMAGAAAAQENTETILEETMIVDDITPYNGAIGPASPLYGLKIAFEELDESFTANETDRFTMQMNTSKLRLSEVKRELLRNNTDAASRALDLYEQKTNMTRLRLQAFTASNATGLLHAQSMSMKHQLVLENLLDSHPGNRGLTRAYNNSLTLEEKFQEKTQSRFERIMQKNNATIVKPFRLDVREQEYARNTGQNQTRQVQQGAEKVKDASKGQSRVTTTLTSPSRQQVQTAATIVPVRTTGTRDRSTAGTGNTGNSHGNSSGNSVTNPDPVTGSGKNR